VVLVERRIDARRLSIHRAHMFEISTHTVHTHTCENYITK